MDIFTVFLWYAFGWLGTVLLFLTVLYVSMTIYRVLRLEDKQNINSPERRLIARIYEYLVFDWTGDKLSSLRVPLPIVYIMVILAMFGTYMIPVSFVVSGIAFITILMWQQLQNNKL